jgi:quercetin dioxygenase-like cupin family protein
VANEAHTLYVPADGGPAYWGPGDRYTFLVTGEQSGGAYFILDALVAPGGGPPPHIHEREEECFFLLEGSLTMTIGEQSLRVSTGDFVQVPRGTVHTFTNIGEAMARMVVIFSPAGMEHWMTAAFDPAPDRVTTPPPPGPEMIARMIAAAPLHGVQFV